MKRTAWPWMLGVVASVAIAGTSRDRRMVPQADGPGFAGRFALVVGVGKHTDPKTPGLPHSVAGARGLQELLVDPKIGGFDPAAVVVLADGAAEAALKPTRDNILSQLRIAARVAARPKDTLLFYFCGHAIERDGALYLLGSDSALDSPLETGIPLAWVQQILAAPRCKAERKIVVLDAPHAQPMSEAFYREAIQWSGVALFTACKAGETSLNHPEKRRTVFSYFLLTGLLGAADARGNKDKYVDLAELKTFVRNYAADWAKKNGKAQTPVVRIGVPGTIYLTAAGEGELPDPVDPGDVLPPDEPATGSLVLSADVSGLTVTVDGKEVWTTQAGKTKQLAEVPAGRRQVRAALRRDVLFQRAVQVAKGGAATVDIVLGWARIEMARVKAMTSRGPDTVVLNVYTNRIGMRFVLLKPGHFEMGSAKSAEQLKERWPLAKVSYDDELPRHTVRLTRPFYIGLTEVTRAQFAQFAKGGYRTQAERDPYIVWGLRDGKWGPQRDFNWKSPGYPQKDDHPVVAVTWDDAKAFCAWLSKKSGTECALPTEAQWEFACRAGADTLWPWGDREEQADGKANVHGLGESVKGEGTFKNLRDGYSFTAPVGSFLANAYGLYDMIGNVSEWCEDWYAADHYKSAGGLSTDPLGPDQGRSRVIRGGSWLSAPWQARSAERNKIPLGRSMSRTGFRVVVNPK